jgi:hypothetical protein|tara:strand:+ start:119 stop:418 length:300 start_codon:yes stop_codon:yes gene_type:complete
MRQWLCNLICKTNSDEAVAERAFEDDLQSKINSIKKRIAAMERTIGRRNRSSNNSQAQAEFMVEKAQRSERNNLQSSDQKQTQGNKDLDRLKAKLMGKK